MEATARAHPNIAVIKYWGRVDHERNLPANSSLSMTMGGLHTTTTVRALPKGSQDQVFIDGSQAGPAARERVVKHLGRMRALAKGAPALQVVSRNSFPQGSGLASSASAFAALTVACNEALALGLGPKQCSVLARHGSGSAARSLFGGWVAWWASQDSDASFAEQVAPQDHMEVEDVVVLVSKAHKKVGSSEGHPLADTSPFHAARVAGIPKLMDQVLAALKERDMPEVGRIAELDALAMHAVMMTSEPSLLYWQPGTMQVLHAVRDWREEGLEAWFTIDAGPNVHLLTAARVAPELVVRLKGLGFRDDQILRCPPGPDPALLREHLRAP